jgi:hypothetical protein
LGDPLGYPLENPLGDHLRDPFGNQARDHPWDISGDPAGDPRGEPVGGLLEDPLGDPWKSSWGKRSGETNRPTKPYQRPREPTRTHQATQEPTRPPDPAQPYQRLPQPTSAYEINLSEAGGWGGAPRLCGHRRSPNWLAYRQSGRKKVVVKSPRFSILELRAFEKGWTQPIVPSFQAWTIMRSDDGWRYMMGSGSVS